MGREIHKLTVFQLRALASVPGLHSDGGGLCLCCRPPRASWVLRYMLDGTARSLGLGRYPDVSLAKAREKAAKERAIIKGDRRDPVAERKAARAANRLERAKAMTFQQCAEAFIADNKSGWKNAKHAKQWSATLATYAYPVFGSLPIAEIDTGLVSKVLRPIWSTKTETAGRLRGRIESVLDWATVSGYRTGENPARWRGHLDNVLPAPTRVKKVEHHAALPYQDVGDFMTALRNREATAARALEFAILTAARTGEVIGARRKEIDLRTKVWTVPAERMKAGEEHRVPLSRRAVEIIEAQDEAAGESAPSDRFLFPGPKAEKPLSNMSMLTLLRRMKRDDVTTHGFRSTFRDWAAERTNYPPEVAEMALAHTVSDKVEAAYRRGDLFDKRQKLMTAWAEFCATPSKHGRDATPIRKLR